MGKRQVPDFDSTAAFEDALARKKPELVARLGGPFVAAVDEIPAETGAEAESPVEDQLRPEPVLTIVGASGDTNKRPKRRGVEVRPRRGVVDRANGTQLRRLTVYVELDLAQRLRKHCFEHELNLSEVAAEALGLGLETLIKGGRGDRA